MTGQADSTKSFCVDCGLQMSGRWTFCPRCGAERVEFAAESLGTTAAATPQREAAGALTRQVKALVDGGRLDEAAVLLEIELTVERSVPVLLMAADVTSRRFRVNEATDLLNEALKLDPAYYLTHVRRAEHFGRVGLYPQALEEVKQARRQLPTSNVPVLVYCQELERVLRDNSRGSFVSHASLPRLPSRFKGRKKPAV